MKSISLTGMALLLGLATPAFAAGVDADAVIGGALGGAAGAAVGSAVGGRDGAIIGGAIGGATGAAIATSDKRKEPARQTTTVKKEVVYVREDEHERHDNGLHRGHDKRKHKHKHKRGHDHHD